MMMRVGRKWSVVALLLAVTGILCSAAPRIQIRIVPRPRNTPEIVADEPVPIRPPMDPSGPYSSYIGAIPCIKESKVDLDGQTVLLDFCHLKNVTFIEDKPTTSEMSESGSSQGSQVVDADDTARDDLEGDDDPTPTPPARKILGIFRGWHIDPITRKYKTAIFDDGDYCRDYGPRYSISAELVPAKTYGETPRVFDFRQIADCQYACKVEAYVGEYELTPSNGIQTPGILDLSDPEETIAEACAVRKCKYDMVSAKVDTVQQEIESVKRSLEDMITSESTSVASLTLTSATTIIKSSTDIMERALELLQAIEELHVEVKASLPAAEDQSATVEVVAQDGSAAGPEQQTDVAATD